MSIRKTLFPPTWWCLLISEHWRWFGKCFLDNIAAADQLQQCSSGPRTLHDLSCQFGTKGNFLKDKTDSLKKHSFTQMKNTNVWKYQLLFAGFSKEMRQIAGGSQSGLRKFLQQVHLFKKNKQNIHNIESLVSYILWGGRDRETRNVVWRKVGERIFQGFQLISSGLELNPGRRRHWHWQGLVAKFSPPHATLPASASAPAAAAAA